MTAGSTSVNLRFLTPSLRSSFLSTASLRYAPIDQKADHFSKTANPKNTAIFPERIFSARKYAPETDLPL